MRNNIRAAASCFLVLLAWAVSAPVGAVSVSFLGIEGELGPGGAGT